MSRTSRLRHDQRGAVYVETLIAFMPLLLTFFSVLQVMELYAAKLMVRRAASAAVRAAVVVLSDNPENYECENGTGPTEGSDAPKVSGAEEGAAACMLADLVEAARIVLAAGHGFRASSGPQVHVTGELSGHSLITAEVRASYRCFTPPFGIVCGTDRMAELSARASLPYQGADYKY